MQNNFNASTNKCGFLTSRICCPPWYNDYSSEILKKYAVHNAINHTSSCNLKLQPSVVTARHSYKKESGAGRGFVFNDCDVLWRKDEDLAWSNHSCKWTTHASCHERARFLCVLLKMNTQLKVYTRMTTAKLLNQFQLPLNVQNVYNKVCQQHSISARTGQLKHIIFITPKQNFSQLH